MPSAKPRIALVLEQPRYDLLKRLAALQGVSMASVVCEVMETVYPVLERVCVVLEAGKRAQESQKQGMRDAVEKAEADLLPHLYTAINQFDMFMDEAAEATGADLKALKSSEEVLRKFMEED